MLQDKGLLSPSQPPMGRKGPVTFMQAVVLSHVPGLQDPLRALAGHLCCHGQALHWAPPTLGPQGKFSFSFLPPHRHQRGTEEDSRPQGVSMKETTDKTLAATTGF